MHSRFEALGLRAKVALAFALLILLTLAAGVVSLASHGHALGAVEAFFDRDARIAELALRSSAAMLKARRDEKDFLLKAREFSHEEAKSRYFTLLQIELADVRQNMATIRALADTTDMTEQASAIERATLAYEDGFRRVVELHGRLGRVDTGLEGDFRRRAHLIEALLKQRAPDRLTVGLLALRRAEKDFVLRRSSIYAQTFDRHAEHFRRDVTRSALPPGDRQRLLRLVDEYQAQFHEYVTVDEAIDAASRDYLASVHTVEPMLARLHARATDAAASTRSRLVRLGRETAWTVGAAGLGRTAARHRCCRPDLPQHRSGAS